MKSCVVVLILTLFVPWVATAQAPDLWGTKKVEEPKKPSPTSDAEALERFIELLDGFNKIARSHEGDCESMRKALNEYVQANATEIERLGKKVVDLVPEVDQEVRFQAALTEADNATTSCPEASMELFAFFEPMLAGSDGEIVKETTTVEPIQPEPVPKPAPVPLDQAKWGPICLKYFQGVENYCDSAPEVMGETCVAWRDAIKTMQAYPPMDETTASAYEAGCQAGVDALVELKKSL